jgi:hypothetical protein
VQVTFVGEVIYWRGPSPWHFVAIPDGESHFIADHAAELTYGWGAIPVRASIGDVSFTTSLFPKDGRYFLPVKSVVRTQTKIELGDVVAVSMDLGAY